MDFMCGIVTLGQSIPCMQGRERKYRTTGCYLMGSFDDMVFSSIQQKIPSISQKSECFHCRYQSSCKTGIALRPVISRQANYVVVQSDAKLNLLHQRYKDLARFYIRLPLKRNIVEKWICGRMESRSNKSTQLKHFGRFNQFAVYQKSSAQLFFF